MAMAVNPLFIAAKHIFRPLAGPKSEWICLKFNTSARFSPLTGADASGSGPEITTAGLYHDGALAPLSVTLGGPPRIPPSIMRSRDRSLGSSAITCLAVRGDIA